MEAICPSIGEGNRHCRQNRLDRKEDIMKKKLALLLTLAMACTATACGSPAATTQGTDAGQTDSAAQSDTAQDTETEEIELEVAYWGDKAEIAMKSALLEQYEKEHPGIKIKQTYTDGGTYQAKIQMWFSSGKAPDVLGIANDLIEPYKDLGVIENLAPYMERDGLLDGNTWEQAAVDSFSFGENIFAAPYVYKSLAIAYNKDLFDEAGLSYPTPDWTEEEMLEAARKLTKGEGQDKQWGIRLGTYPTNFYRNMFGQPIYQVGERKMNMKGNAELEYAFTLLSDMVKEGLSPNETFDSMLGAGFETGKFGMAVVAPWDMSGLDSMIGDSFAWDIEVLPKNETFHTSWKGYLFADGFTMSSSCKEKEAAWELIKWLTANEEAQKASAAAGVPMYMPYATSLEYLNEFTTTNHYNKAVFVEMLKNSVGGQTTGVWAQINDEANLQFQRVVAGEIDVQEAIDTIEKKGNEFLQNN